MEQILLVVLTVLLVMVLIFHFIQTNSINQELDMLREAQRLDDLEDEAREKELGDLKYRQDRYDRWRYWAGPYWNRSWRGGRHRRPHGHHHP